MRSVKIETLPLPPQFDSNGLTVPPFLRFDHPYTKWMINIIRNTAHIRLSTTIKERPELFRQYFQLPDEPSLFDKNKRDNHSLFHKKAMLYLNPLCIALFFKLEKSVEIILKSGINHAFSMSYACDVYLQGISGGDILEILPTQICIRREFYEGLPILANISATFLSKNSKMFIEIDKTLLTKYQSRVKRKIVKYTDVLHYATETMKSRYTVNIAKLLVTLLQMKPEIWQPHSLTPDKKGHKISLFRRIARIAYYDDKCSSKSHNIVLALDYLCKQRTFVDVQPTPDTKLGFQSRIQSLDPIILDQDCSISLLLGLYYRMHCKRKMISTDTIANILYRILISTKWFFTFIKLPAEHLQKVFSCLPENVTIPAGGIVAIKKHVNSLKAKSSQFGPLLDEDSSKRIPATELRNKHDDCSLLKLNPLSESESGNRPPTLTSYINASADNIGYLDDNYYRSVQREVTPESFDDDDDSSSSRVPTPTIRKSLYGNKSNNFSFKKISKSKYNSDFLEIIMSKLPDNHNLLKRAAGLSDN